MDGEEKRERKKEGERERKSKREKKSKRDREKKRERARVAVQREREERMLKKGLLLPPFLVSVY